MNSVLEQIIATNQVESNQGDKYQVHSHVSQTEGEFLQGIINDIKPQNTLEVGLAYGVSAMFICDALADIPNAHHITIDPAQTRSFQGIGLSNLERAGHKDRIEFHELPSHIALPQLEAKGVKVDFAFIDGWHTFDHTLIDFFLVDRLLKVGGILAIDDANWPAIRKVCRFIATNRAYEPWRAMPVGQAFFRQQLFANLSPLTSRLRRFFRPEFIEPDTSLGLLPGSQCLVFKKLSDDDRRWDDYTDF
ncbi:O-methyltransferase family 3 [Thalassoporum mexicanum PCC 7367]|uniref:O-methyltransferase n=1 Tax=Thalassoporum mexicanum TaxID=3457544 RepID=UPI00029F8D79|nr:class I SAM-dependent methyltransferase [Pseudanabaena sp. PCC 7367]AFY71877.1 O-methyltransferase family 3 [Pseudanabaena sp. PCC 7367]